LPEDLAKLLHEHSKSLEHGLILDLRESCVGDPKLGYEMADLFIRDGAVLGKILVQREEKKLLPKRGLRARSCSSGPGDGVALLDFPLVVLVDFTTAGPGEILAGALKHAGRARIVGEKTFGYAALRQTFPLSRESRSP
jgi:C-terminal processing protease CtpA/Prc